MKHLNFRCLLNSLEFSSNFLDFCVRYIYLTISDAEISIHLYFIRIDLFYVNLLTGWCKTIFFITNNKNIIPHSHSKNDVNANWTHLKNCTNDLYNYSNLFNLIGWILFESQCTLRWKMRTFFLVTVTRIGIGYHH